MFWRNRSRLAARVLGAGAIGVTNWWAETLLDRTPSYVPWLRTVILVAGVTAVAAMVAAPFVPRITRRLTLAALGLGLVAALSGPVAYTATTISTAHTGSIPTAGPATAGGGFGGGDAPGGTGNTNPPGGGGTGFTGSPPTGSSGVLAGTSSSGTRGTRPSGTNGTAKGIRRSGATGVPTGSRVGAGPGGAGGGAGGGGGVSTNAALTEAVKTGAGSYRWVVATFGSQSAATLELASGEPVMAIGGFNGEGGNVSLTTFEGYVANGDIHYFIASGTGGGAGGPSGTSNSDAAIMSWVKVHFNEKTIGGRTVYDLSSPL